MNLSRRSSGLKPATLDYDIKSIVDYINSEEYLTFTVATAGAEVAVSHHLEHIPSHFVQAGDESHKGTGVVYCGSTAWTKNKVYLTATVAGDYAVKIRR